MDLYSNRIRKNQVLSTLRISVLLKEPRLMDDAITPLTCLFFCLNELLFNNSHFVLETSASILFLKNKHRKLYL